jgi:hypothetical protein
MGKLKFQKLIVQVVCLLSSFMYVLRLDFKHLTDLALTKEWSMDIFVEILDHFGLDRNDVLTYQTLKPLGVPFRVAGFPAWWDLQHQRSYVPFKTKIRFEQNIKGGL